MQQYRNDINVVSIEGIEVEPHSLWQMQTDGILVLVDDDQYATHPLTDAFYNID